MRTTGQGEPPDSRNTDWRYEQEVQAEFRCNAVRRLYGPLSVLLYPGGTGIVGTRILYRFRRGGERGTPEFDLEEGSGKPTPPEGELGRLVGDE